MGTDTKPSLPGHQEFDKPGFREKLRDSSLGRFLGMGGEPPLRRRLRFAVLVVISQLLLIALAIAWLVHMVIIAVNGAVYFIERNPFILWIEVAATILVIVFAVSVFVAQLKRLGERRSGDDRRSGGRE